MPSTATERRLASHLFHNYTESALKDEVVDELLGRNDCEIIIDEVGREYILVFHPYVNQAEGVLYTINLKDPVPEFVIWISHHPVDLAVALDRLGTVAMKQVITEAVRTIYETIDPQYYRKNAIHGKVKWRLGDG